MPEIAIRCEGLAKRYSIGEPERYRNLRDVISKSATGPFRWLLSKGNNGGSSDTKANNFIWALDDVSFEINQGDAVGIIGRNGAGKSTLLKILSRITKPTHGHVEIKGRVGSLLEVGTGFHPELTGRENIYLNGAILGMRKAEIERKFDEIVAFSEVEKFIDTPVKRYSSGMYVRLAFAVAAHLETEILIIDEVLAVGDQAFQTKCLGKMNDVARQGRTVLLVSHSMPAITALANKGLLLQDGGVCFQGEVHSATQMYLSSRSIEQTRWSRPINEQQSEDQSVRITDLSLTDATGIDRSVFSSGEDVEVRIKCKVAANCAHQILSVVMVKTVTEVSVFHEMKTFETDEWKQTGEVTLICRLLNCSLYPGKYSISVWLGRSAYQEIDYVKDALTFTLEQGVISGVNFDLNWKHGLVHCPSEWSVGASR